MLGKIVAGKIIKEGVEASLSKEQKETLKDPEFVPDVIKMLGDDAKEVLSGTLSRMKKGAEWMTKLVNPRKMAEEFLQSKDERDYHDRRYNYLNERERYHSDRGPKRERKGVSEIIFKAKEWFAQKISGQESVEDPELAKMRDRYVEILREIILERTDKENEELPENLEDIGRGEISSVFYDTINPRYERRKDRSLDFLRHDEGFVSRAEAMMEALNSEDSDSKLETGEGEKI